MSAPEFAHGRCACGAIAFRCRTAAASAVHCHCIDCRRATGSAFATVVAFPPDAFVLERGEPAQWVVTGTSGGRVAREFCATCGSPLFTRADHGGDAVFVKAGAFDDPSWIEPAMACWTKRALPWARLPEDLDGVPETP